MLMKNKGQYKKIYTLSHKAGNQQYWYLLFFSPQKVIENFL